MFFHGGGYCSGSIRSHRRLVDRGRPGGRSPHARGGLSPCAGAPVPRGTGRRLDGLATLCERQGIAAGHIVVGGGSAGGGLTLALIGQLQEAWRGLPACMWLLSPWTDLTMSGSTLATKDSVDPIIHGGYLHELADAYLPSSQGPKRCACLAAVMRISTVCHLS